jgi:hypothetical protein
MRETDEQYRDWRAALLPMWCAIPMPVLGVIIGIQWARWDIQRHAAEHPEMRVCGLPVAATAFIGIILGSIGGVIAGAVVACIVGHFLRDE